MQATGIDDRGRKQYLYHPRWREIADAEKFDRLAEIGQALPRIRRRVAADLRSRTLSTSCIIAAMVRLLDATGIRIGNAEYRRDNGSYGLTTLARRHVTVRGSVVHLSFEGKGGVRQQLEVNDRQLARVVRSCLKHSGKFLFQVPADDGLRRVSSDDVNRYLDEASRGLVTAKDFRTWQASVCVAAELASNSESRSCRRSRRACKSAISKAAALLGNTTTVCRKYYVHAGVVDAFNSGELPKLLSGFAPHRRKWFRRDEQLLLHVLRHTAG